MVENFIKYDKDGFPFLDYGNGLEWHMEVDDVEGIWKEKAEKELRETPENIEKALEELRKLVLADDELFMAIEKEYLMKFLRPCKFYAQSAYEKMRNFYRLRESKPHVYFDMTPVGLKDLTCYGICEGQPVRDQHGRRITLLRFGKLWDPTKVTTDDIRRIIMLGADAAAIEPMTQINGIVNIIDLDGFGLKHCMQWTPKNAFDMVDFVLNKAPIRLKAVHIINAPIYLDALIRIVKPFMNAKLRSRMFIHKSPKGLLEHLDPKCVRKEYGGTLELPENDHIYANKWFQCFEEEFKLAARFGYNKSYKVPVYDGMFYDATPIIKKFNEKEARKKGKQNGGIYSEPKVISN